MEKDNDFLEIYLKISDTKEENICGNGNILFESHVMLAVFYKDECVLESWYSGTRVRIAISVHETIDEFLKPFNAKLFVSQSDSNDSTDLVNNLVVSAMSSSDVVFSANLMGVDSVNHVGLILDRDLGVYHEG